MQRSHSDSSRGGVPPSTSRAFHGSEAGTSKPASPRRQLRRGMPRSVTTGSGPITPARMDSVSSYRVGNRDAGGDGSNGVYSWWTPGYARPGPVVLEGWMKKRSGRINHWADRYYVLRERTLAQFGKGEDNTFAEPKHLYELDPACSISEIKEVKAGGKTIFLFQVNWPQLPNAKEEGAENRAGQEEDSGDSEGANPSYNSPASDIPTPVDSPVDAKSRKSGEDESGLPLAPPLMHSVRSNGSLVVSNNASSVLGQPQELRRRARSSITPAALGSNSGVHSGISSSATSTVASPALAGARKKGGGQLSGEDECRNETIEHMVAAQREAQREDEMRRALIKQEEMEQLTEYEQEKVRRQDKIRKREKKAAASRGQAVAATAVGVSWLTAGIATGGLVLAGGLVAAGVAMGSMGVYHKYKSKNPSGRPSHVRLASDKLEVAEQWRTTIRDLLEQLQTLPQQTREMGTLGTSAWMGRGLGLGITGWTAPRPTMPPPALKAIDLRVVDEMLGNAVWMSRDVIHGLAILEQDLSAAAGALKGEGGGEGDGVGVCLDASRGNGSERSACGGLGGVGPVLKAQTTVRASPLETFVALMGAPRNAMSSVISGIISVQSMDDHSDVVRMCARPAWLKLAWAAPRDFCLARYWHMAEDGCYIVCLSSMEHPLCPVAPGFVRGEMHVVYTISPRRDSLPGADSQPECLLACHAQVDPKGWVMSSLGFRERYTSHLLMHVLEVRNVIEAERFIAPRISLRPDSPSSCSSIGVGNHATEDGGPFLFEVLGAPGSQEPGTTVRQPSGAWGKDDRRKPQPLSKCYTSLENNPPPTLDARMWAEANGTEFSVRAASYLTNRLKVPSAKQVFRLRAVDMFVLPQPATHIASHPTNRVQIARQAGEKTFVWVLQIMVPGPPHYAFMCYFTPESDNWCDTSTPFGSLAQRVFFGDDDSFRDERLKLIPKIVEGNWVVKRAAGNTPAILGTKLKQHHFRGDNYLETDLEIASSSVAANITRLCTGYAKSLVVDMAWTIQGNTEAELPEVVLAGVRIHHLDIQSAAPLDPAATESSQQQQQQQKSVG